MAEEEDRETAPETIRPQFPAGRVKRIVKIDPDINKVNSEALFLISCSAELFLRFLAEKSAAVAADKKRRTVKLDHIVAAVKRHRPTSEFLLDSLPAAAPPPARESPAERNRTRAAAEKPAPVGTRRIDEFFKKPLGEAGESVDLES